MSDYVGCFTRTSKYLIYCLPFFISQQVVTLFPISCWHEMAVGKSKWNWWCSDSYVSLETFEILAILPHHLKVFVTYQDEKYSYRFLGIFFWYFMFRYIYSWKMFKGSSGDDWKTSSNFTIDVPFFLIRVNRYIVPCYSDGNWNCPLISVALRKHVRGFAICFGVILYRTVRVTFTL